MHQPSLLPPLQPGMRVGLLGGSFDPPHQGHLAISQQALSALNLHAVIWLVSPQNPLKAHQPAPQSNRLTACRELIQHPRIFASDIESAWRTQYSIDTIRAFKRHYPDTHFVWLVGSDNFATFHHWHRWDDIMQTIALAIYPRLGSQLRAGLGPAAQRFAQARCAPAALAALNAPAWAVLSGPYHPIASRDLRAEQAPGNTEPAYSGRRDGE